MSVLFWLKQNPMAECIKPEHELSPPGWDRFTSYCSNMEDKLSGKVLRSSPYGKLGFGRRPATPMQHRWSISFKGDPLDSTEGQSASDGSTSAIHADVDEARELPLRQFGASPLHRHTAIRGKQAAPLWFWMEWEKKIGNMPPAGWKDIKQAQGYFESWYLHRLNLEQVELLAYKQKREACREEWYGLLRGERAMWLACAMFGKAAIEVPLIDETIPVHNLPHGVTLADIQEGKRVRGIMLTYHGDWGFDLPEISKTIDAGIVGDELTAMLAGHPYYMDLADKFFDHCLKLGRINGFSQVSISLEHCTKGEDPQRVHFHVMMSGGFKRLSVQYFDDFTFDGVRPSHCVCTTNGRAKAKKKEGQSDARMNTRANEAHFYLQFRKVGMLYSRTNYHKHTDFLVSSRWIMNNWKTRKLTYEHAREEVIAGRDRVKNTLVELDFQHTLHVKETQQVCQARVKFLLRRNLLEFREEPLEVQQWKAQYHDRNFGRLSRFKPLILDGPTRLGKTMWATSFFGSHCTLVLQCQGVSEPSLHAIRNNSQAYKCIVFDEGCWQLVHEHKMLFQAGQELVTVCQSPTNQSAYDVFVYALPMIVCSNQFRKDIDAEAAAYLRENTFYLYVNDKCYVIPTE
jgi:hypothetical protein